jgi:hypothetical protein
LSENADYEIEVSAANHEASEYTSLKESSIFIDSVEIGTNDKGQITLNWACEQSIPEGGWIVKASIDGTDIVNTYTSEENAITLSTAIPDQKYTITINAANDAPVICDPIVYDAEPAKDFSGKFAGASVSRENFEFTMCIAPEKTNWTYNDVKANDKVNVFTSGTKAGFVTRAKVYYGVASDEIQIMYVFKNADGALISATTQTEVWKNIWGGSTYRGVLNIPELPTAQGEYSLSLYFDGMLMHEQNFTIQ